MNAPLKHNSPREAPNDSEGKRADNAGRAMPASSRPVLTFAILALALVIVVRFAM